jgi:hypothetical protein
VAERQGLRFRGRRRGRLVLCAQEAVPSERHKSEGQNEGAKRVAGTSFAGPRHLGAVDEKSRRP